MRASVRTPFIAHNVYNMLHFNKNKSMFWESYKRNCAKGKTQSETVNVMGKIKTNQGCCNKKQN